MTVSQRGCGSVGPVHGGWRWRSKVNGKTRGAAGYATREAAEQALARYLETGHSRPALKPPSGMSRRAEPGMRLTEEAVTRISQEIAGGLRCRRCHLLLPCDHSEEATT